MQDPETWAEAEIAKLRERIAELQQDADDAHRQLEGFASDAEWCREKIAELEAERQRLRSACMVIAETDSDGGFSREVAEMVTKRAIWGLDGNDGADATDAVLAQAEQRGFERGVECATWAVRQWHHEGDDYETLLADLGRIQFAKPPEQQLQRDQNLAEAMHGDTDGGAKRGEKERP